MGLLKKLFLGLCVVSFVIVTTAYYFTNWVEHTPLWNLSFEILVWLYIFAGVFAIVNRRS